MLGCLLPISVIAQADPTTIFFNGTIFTAEKKQPFVEAVAIKGDRIIAVGSLKKVKKKAGKNADLTDLQGKTLMPGFIDSHLHGVGRGTFLTKAHLGDKWLPYDQLATYATEVLQNGKAVYGNAYRITGFNLNYWSDPAKLSAIWDQGKFEKMPVVLRGMDGHTAWANRAMFQKLGIDAAFIRAQPANMQMLYGHDEAFNPNGLLTEAAMAPAMAAIPKLSPEDQMESGKAAVRYFNSCGLTGIVDLACDKDLPLYRRLAEANELKVRASAYPIIHPDDPIEPQLAYVDSLRKVYAKVPRLNIPGIKVFADGVAEFPTQTAVMSKPYMNTGHWGNIEFQPENYYKCATIADKQGYVVHVHAIGDSAVTLSLNGIETARKANGNSGLPHTITHLQFVQPKDFQRFKQLGVVASFQLYWAVADTAYTRMVEPYINTDIYKWQYPARSIFDAGGVIAGASDWPVSTANPFDAIYSAETRRGETPLVLDAKQAMNRLDMFYAYTIEAAKTMLLEQEIGSMKVGKKADLVLLDRAVLTVDPISLKATQVLWTMLDGQKVFEHQLIQH